MSTISLEASIPANNEKIIELYNKVKSGQLDPSPDFQRKLVWKTQHKINFIDTILNNFPFPEIYKAPGELDLETLTLKDIVVDGQQRITTIRNFIDGTDIFAYPSTKVKFSTLSKEEKERFLNYEVSVRYLKNASKEQVKEIFQRINNTEYRLNSTERLNAQWGDSELVHFTKLLLDGKYEYDEKLFNTQIEPEKKRLINDFFLDKKIFSDNDISRMLSLQWMLSVLTTIIEEKYYGRYSKIQSYIERYNEEIDIADDLTTRLYNVIVLINKCSLDYKSYWLSKTNLFSLLVERSKYDVSAINVDKFNKKLLDLEINYIGYITKTIKEEDINSAYLKFFEHSRDSGNEVAARLYRGSIVEEFIKSSINS